MKAFFKGILILILGFISFVFILSTLASLTDKKGKSDNKEAKEQTQETSNTVNWYKWEEIESTYNEAGDVITTNLVITDIKNHKIENQTLINTIRAISLMRRNRKQVFMVFDNKLDFSDDFTVARVEYDDGKYNFDIRKRDYIPDEKAFKLYYELKKEIVDNIKKYDGPIPEKIENKIFNKYDDKYKFERGTFRGIWVLFNKYLYQESELILL